MQFSESATGQRTVSIDLREIIPTTARGLLTKNGITLSEGESKLNDYTGEVYEAWMQHGYFGTGRWSTDNVDGTGYDADLYWSLAGGVLTRSRPTETAASWSGLMVGMSTAGASTGNRLQGDATLTYTIAGGSAELDAAFTDIVDLDRTAAHSIRTVNFNDVPVQPNGTFASGMPDARISGAFYGPGHAEVIGVFEQPSMTGAFGAKRQAE